MSASVTPQTPICRVDPCEHAKLQAHVRRLTASDGLMEQVIRHVKASNSLAQHNNNRLGAVTWLFVLCLLLLLVTLSVAWKTLSDVSSVERRLDVAVKDLNELSKQVASAEVQIRQVRESTDRATEERDSQPRIELVTEPDPKKAKDAPIKVRITPPTHPTASETHIVRAVPVEVPLPKESIVHSPDSGEK